MSSGDSDETGSEDESIKFDTIQRAGRRSTMVEKEEGWYRLSDPPPKFLTGEGKKIFNDLKAIFNVNGNPKVEKKDNIKKRLKL